ncbi:MAG: tetratricopeptide (TPR) repeat protein, partial [Candidatus Omnitrophota bacterium]
AISVDPQFLPTYSNLAYLYLNLNKEEMAIQNFKKRFELSMLSDEWTEKAKDELLKISPSYQRWISTIEAKRLGDEILRKQRQRFKTNLIRSREFYLLGEKLFDQGKPKEAVKHYNMALKYTPANPKIVKARKIAIVALTEEHIKMGTEQALRQLSIGDSKSAKHEIQKILATMPSESINQFK